MATDCFDSLYFTHFIVACYLNTTPLFLLIVCSLTILLLFSFSHVLFFCYSFINLIILNLGWILSILLLGGNAKSCYNHVNHLFVCLLFDYYSFACVNCLFFSILSSCSMLPMLSSCVVLFLIWFVCISAHHCYYYCMGWIQRGVTMMVHIPTIINIYVFVF